MVRDTVTMSTAAGLAGTAVTAMHPFGGAVRRRDGACFGSEVRSHSCFSLLRQSAMFSEICADCECRRLSKLSYANNAFEKSPSRIAAFARPKLFPA